MTNPATADDAATADRVEAAAYVDLVDAAPAGLKDRLGLRIERVADATLLLAPHMPVPMFNRAIGLGLTRPATPDDADAVAAAFRNAGAPHWWLHWNPQARPAGFAQVLRDRGWSTPARATWAKMLRDAASAPRIATSLEVEAARDDEIEATTQAIAAAFEMPPFMGAWLAAMHGRPRWHLYTVRDGERIVGGGCLFVDGATAWLGMGAVLASHRRRGGQGALMARRIADAIEAGATSIATETGESVDGEPNPSLDNMRRCGFVRVASRLNLVAPG